MNNDFGYIGKVTLKTIHNDKVIHTEYYNRGTYSLFTAYAMAMAGNDISYWLPSYVDVGVYDKAGVFNTALRASNGVSVVRTFVINNGTPITRISVTLTNDMISSNVGAGNVVLRLLSFGKDKSVPNNNILAELTLDVDKSEEFWENISHTPNGQQLILLWDLQVTNKSAGGTV